MPRFSRVLLRSVLPMAKVLVIFRGRLKSPSNRSTSAGLAHGHELPDAAGVDRPFQAAIGAQIAVGPADAGDQHHLAAHRGHGLARLEFDGHVVPRQLAQRLVEVALVRAAFGEWPAVGRQRPARRSDRCPTMERGIRWRPQRRTAPAPRGDGEMGTISSMDAT